MLNSFEPTKEKLANATLLAFPDRAAELSLQTDASDHAVLQQKINNSWQPLSFFSRKLKPAQTRYSTYDRELLAIYSSVKHFKH